MTNSNASRRPEGRSKITSVLQYMWGELRRSRLALFGLVVAVFLVAIAALAPVLAPADPTAIDIPNRFAPPSLSHPFGTDKFGRDVLSRVLYGARISLQVGFVSVILGLIVGVFLGAIAAYTGGFVDGVVMRSMDALLAFPSIMLALLLRFVLGPSITSVMIAIAIIRIPVFARTVRSSVLAEREREYVTAARSVGQTHFKILFRHILPNALTPVIVLVTVLFANAMLIEASMSFLGIGTPPPQPSWGIMLSDGREFMQNHPHVVLFPGLAISVVVLGINLLGDGLRDILDPRILYQ
jgi:ABC-type dipeptide/oligopeptide/nickel transport system permease subunit